MPESQLQETPATSRPRAPFPWRCTSWLCAGVIAASVFSCVVMAATRSKGLTKITVTALNKDLEPRDHNLPLIKQTEALPDYELLLILSNGFKVHLGAKPDTSAIGGLTWNVNDPVSIADVASVRLQEQDKVISDAVAEAQVLGDSTTVSGYRFQFVTERSAFVGIKSFFGTPVGQAIAAGFCIAVMLMIVGVFCA